MSYLDRLRAHDDFLERPAPPSAKSAKTPLNRPFDTFGTATPGPSEKNGPSLDTSGTALAGAFQKTMTEEIGAQEQATLHALPTLGASSPSHDFSESLPPPSAKSAKSPDAQIGDAFERAIVAAAKQGKSIRLSDGKLEIVDRPSWRWLVTHPDESVVDHTTTPHATRAEMAARYPQAVAFRPLYFVSTPIEEAAA